MKLVCRGPSVADVLWTTNTTACDRVLLTSDIWSLGRDTTWQLDVGEDRVVLGHGNVHLLIGGNSLCLLLSLQNLLLQSIDVALIDVGGVLRILLGLFDSTIGLDLDLVCHGIELVELVFDDL